MENQQLWDLSFISGPLKQPSYPHLSILVPLSRCDIPNGPTARTGRAVRAGAMEVAAAVEAISGGGAHTAAHRKAGPAAAHTASETQIGKCSGLHACVCMFVYVCVRTRVSFLCPHGLTDGPVSGFIGSFRPHLAPRGPGLQAVRDSGLL